MKSNLLIKNNVIIAAMVCVLALPLSLNAATLPTPGITIAQSDTTKMKKKMGKMKMKKEKMGKMDSKMDKDSSGKM